MKNKKSIKASEEFYFFLEKFAVNRVKADIDMQTISKCDSLDILVKYFKSDNNRYLELVKTEVKNGNK